MLLVSARLLASVASAGNNINTSVLHNVTEHLTESETEALPSFAERVRNFCEYMKGHGAMFDSVEVNVDETTCRGLKATCTIGANTTVMSVPMRQHALSANLLLENNFYLQNLHPPSLELVCRHMSANSIHDPILYEQVYLALLLAGERMNEQSRFRDYFNILPHPAINDADVIARYKNILDPLELVDWDGHQRQFVTLLRTLLRKWGNKAPPIEIAYWALRTILCRMHLLPYNVKSPAEYGSSLSYTEFATFEEAQAQTKWRHRLYTLIATTIGSPVIHRSNYSLVPTLIPLIDCAGHVSSSNVQLQVTLRAKRKEKQQQQQENNNEIEKECCVELQSIRQIEKGETIGLRFANTQSHAFTLYRFGFIPV